jgi:hypothetical protein
MNFRKLLTYLTVGTAAVIPFAGAQNPTILQGNYVSNVFGQSNFVLNPNAQTNVANVTNATRSTTTPLVATSEFTLNLTSGSFATWTLRTFDAGMKGQNCEARFSYRGFATATTKAEIVQNSLVVAHLTLTPSTDPRIASINFPCGDLANATTFRIAQTTANMTGTNEIGAIYTGLATNMANVAQAEFVGGGEWQTASGFTRSSAAIQSTFAAYTSGVAGTALGKATSAGTDTTITFPFLPAGQYFVTTNMYNYMYLGGVAFASCEFSIEEIDGGTRSGYGSSGAFVTTNIYPPAASLQGNFNFTTGSQRRFRIVSKNTAANGAGSLCASGQDALAKTGIYVYRFPTSSELVVTPERQNTFGYISGTGLDYTTKSATYVTPSGFTMDPGYGKCVADGTNLACKIETLPPGAYDVTVSAPLFSQGGTSGNQSCYWGISDGVQVDVALAQTLTPILSGSFDFISSVSRQFTYTSTQTNRIFKLIVKEASSAGASSNCAIATSVSRYWSMKVTPLNQPSNSALYVQGPVLGSQTGAAIPAGYVGESKQARASGCGTNSATNDGATITITPGIWRVTANGNADGGAITDFLVFVGPQSGNNSTWRNAYYNDGWIAAGLSGKVPTITPPILVRFDGTNLYRFEDNAWQNAYATTTGTLYAKFYRAMTTCNGVYTAIVAERVN